MCNGCRFKHECESNDLKGVMDPTDCFEPSSPHTLEALRDFPHEIEGSTVLIVRKAEQPYEPVSQT